MFQRCHFVLKESTEVHIWSSLEHCLRTTPPPQPPPGIHLTITCQVERECEQSPAAWAFEELDQVKWLLNGGVKQYSFSSEWITCKNWRTTADSLCLYIDILIFRTKRQKSSHHWKRWYQATGCLSRWKKVWSSQTRRSIPGVSKLSLRATYRKVYEGLGHLMEVRYIAHSFL